MPAQIEGTACMMTMLEVEGEPETGDMKDLVKVLKDMDLQQAIPPVSREGAGWYVWILYFEMVQQGTVRSAPSYSRLISG